LSCAEQDKWYATAFIDELLTWANSESRLFAVGQTVSVGFWIAKLLQTEQGVELCEMCESTGNFHRGCEFAVRVLRHQKTYCEFYSLHFSPVFVGEEAAVHPSVLEGAHARGWRHKSETKRIL
jgi:hypothetical protein